MDEQLINEYINNLANQVNSLNQENILLKTRLGLLEKREADRLQKQEEQEAKVMESFETPKPKKEPEFVTPEPSVPSNPEPEPIPEEPKEKMVRGPRPKGYNPRVDGPRPMIPESSLKDKS